MIGKELEGKSESVRVGALGGKPAHALLSIRLKGSTVVYRWQRVQKTKGGAV